MVRRKTMKRDAHTARKNKRERIHYFMQGENKKEAESYRNLSAREKKLTVNPNSLGKRFDPTEVYESIVAKSVLGKGRTGVDFGKGFLNFLNIENHL